MTLNGRELRIPGWFIATVTLLITISTVSWRISRSFNDLLIEHREHTRIMQRVDRRLCRVEEALRQLGAKITPDVECANR